MNKLSKIIDSTISVFSPKAASERQKYRMLTAFRSEQERRYNAASKGRRTDGWEARGTSANGELAYALPKLRDRSRDLVRNNPYARRAVRAIATNTIGSGIQLSTADKSKKAKNFLSLWKRWAETTECDFDGLHNFYGLQRLAMRSAAESGECLVRRRRYGKYGLQLQVVEGDYIDTAKTAIGLANGGWVSQGVEFDKKGKRVAYWLYDHHPGDPFAFNVVSKRVSVDEVAHIYFVERPGQVRGTPFGVAAMMRLFDFDEYEDAQLMKQKISACTVSFITETGSGLPTTKKEIAAAERMEPGMIEYLAPGQSVEVAAPPSVEGYDAYAKTMLHSIAAGYDVTYEVLTGDYSSVNFSSGRMGWIEFHRSVGEWQDQMMIPMFCDKAFNWFTDAMKISMTTNTEIIPTWTKPRREMIDPVKETAALEQEVRNGFKSWPEAIREKGRDPEEVLNEIQDWNKDVDARKIMLDSDSRIEAQSKLNKVIKSQQDKETVA